MMNGFAGADIMQLPSLARRWCVTRVPTYIFFWQGVEDTFNSEVK